MVLHADYPFLDVLWTMIIFFCGAAWIWLLILIFSDLFRRDVSGWAKAAWVVLVVVMPFPGALVYVIADGKDMTGRRVRDAAASRASTAPSARSPRAATAAPRARIHGAGQLLAGGAITLQRFDQLKAKAPA